VEKCILNKLVWANFSGPENNVKCVKARRNALTHTKKTNSEVDNAILIRRTDESAVSVTVKATSRHANDRNELRPNELDWDLDQRTMTRGGDSTCKYDDRICMAQKLCSRANTYGLVGTTPSQRNTIPVAFLLLHWWQHPFFPASLLIIVTAPD